MLFDIYIELLSSIVANLKGQSPNCGSPNWWNLTEEIKTMIKQIVILFLIGLGMISEAADLTTKSGKTYKDYEVSGVNDKGITIFHESGTATVAPNDWPDNKKDEIQKLLNKYNEKASQIKTLHEKRNDEVLLESIKVTIKEKGGSHIKVISVTSQGVIASEYSYDLSHNVHPTGEPFLLCGLGNKKFIDGEKISWNSKSFWEHTAYKDDGTPYKVNTPCKALVCYNIGTYQYKTASGALKTIRKYTVDKNAAIQSLKKQGD